MNGEKIVFKNVVENAKALAETLRSNGFEIVSGGTDNHLMLIDLSDREISGKEGEHALGRASITVNKNTVPGDKSALNPSGIRLGTPSLTTRGLNKSNIMTVVDFLDAALQIAVEVQQESGPKLVDFKAKIKDTKYTTKIEELKNKIGDFAVKFRLPGHNDI